MAARAVNATEIECLAGEFCCASAPLRTLSADAGTANSAAAIDAAAIVRNKVKIVSQ
jgi:hypothetical protein